MNDENRVLIRRGARDLSTQEMERVTGGLRYRHILLDQR
jgi:hypothetical protein